MIFTINTSTNRLILEDIARQYKTKAESRSGLKKSVKKLDDYFKALKLADEMVGI